MGPVGSLLGMPWPCTLFPGRTGPRLPRQAASGGSGLSKVRQGAPDWTQGPGLPALGLLRSPRLLPGPPLGPAFPEEGLAFPQARLPDRIHRWPCKVSLNA